MVVPGEGVTFNPEVVNGKHLLRDQSAKDKFQVIADLFKLALPTIPERGHFSREEIESAPPTSGLRIACKLYMEMKLAVALAGI